MCVNIDEVLSFNKNDSLFSNSVPFKTMVLEGLLTIFWFSLSKSCKQLFDSLLELS